MRADFSALRRGVSRRVSGEYFFLTATRFPEEESTKVACVVSKKVSAHANVRNLIKRRCRNVLRPLLSVIKEPRALVFHAKREAAHVSFADLKRDIEKLVARI